MRGFGSLVGVLAVVVGSGCKEARYDGPMPVTIGDCAGPSSAWVSGPKAAPFLPEDAKDVQPIDKVAANPPPQDDPPPPPPEDEAKPDDGADESGGTGTAMALEEGKMGKKDNDRDDAQRARQQAIEQARSAGILGASNSEGGAFASLTGTGDVGTGFDDSNIYGGLLGDEPAPGQDGFGPGGTGTGWGTIGTGRYGTIGHGSGTRGRSGRVPTVSIGQPNAQGDLDKAIIRRYIKRNIQKITYCYERQLLVNARLSGTVSVQFFITPNGEVASSEAHGVDPAVSSCVANVIKAIVFPKPKGGGGVQVNYPFTFRPADGGGAATIANAGSGNAGASANSGSPASDAGSATPPAQPKRPPPVPPGGYMTGANNPLRTEQAALEVCFRKAKKHYGVAVFDLAYDDKGAVTKADVHGLEDANVKKCVLAVTKKVKSMGAQKAERCSVSFGEMPLAAAPSIEVKADAIMFGTVKHASIAELSSEDALLFKIPSLFEALEAKMRAAQASIVTIEGPLVIKALDTSKMKIVNKVVSTVLAAGDDFVLAQQAGAGWQLLTPVAFPMVPVPFGTGDFFATTRTRDNLNISADEIVHLSVLVRPDKIWVGISRVNEFQEVPRDPAKLGEVLTGHKQSAFFADRTDIEIAGEGDATYLDVINAIKAAESAGFTRWRIMDPNALSARPQL